MASPVGGHTRCLCCYHPHRRVDVTRGRYATADSVDGRTLRNDGGRLFRREGTFSIGQPASDVDATVQATVEPTETAPTTSPVPSPTVERVDPTSGMFDLSPIPTPTEPPIDQNPIGPSDGIAPEPSPTATATAVLAPLPDPTPTPDASPLVIPTPTPDASPLVIPTPRTAPTVTPSPPQFAIISAYTGFHLDSSGDVIVRRTNRRNSIELKFNADLDPDSVQITDFEIRLNDQS